MKIIITEQQLQNLITEEFSFKNLSYDEQENIYDIFKNSYEKSTGTSWSKDKFMSRAMSWSFFGDKDGFVTVRKQNSGLYKFVGVAGKLTSIVKGIQEINSLNAPTWGMMDKRMGELLVKKYNFIMPPAIIIKTLIKFIPSNVFGNVNFNINNDGSITLHYNDVGDATKFFVANKEYFKFLLTNSTNTVPKIVIKWLKSLLK